MTKKIAVDEAALEVLPKYLKQLSENLINPEEQIIVAAGDWEHQIKFNEYCQIFNRRFKEKPWAIIYCKRASEVQYTYQLAKTFSLPVRIRAGGHDHEGECTGTNTILIDVSLMDKVEVDPETKIAKIGPGNIFKNLTSELADEDVMIAHGTCATVGISGFIMGGGWGPWTRAKGMCCEYLVGADIVLGDGTLIKLNEGDTEPNKKELLWALRGGGGMSYGLVTEFRIQTFELPPELIRFSLEWNPYPNGLGDNPSPDYPTIRVLKAWENAIQSSETSQFIGTNLMINGKPANCQQPFNANTVSHNCVMYGYWQGDEKSLKEFVNEWFASVPNYTLKINPHHGGSDADQKFGANLMSDWARESYNKILAARFQQGANLKLSSGQEKQLLEGKPLPPDYDDPAPHKITSRLVDQQGLGEDGYDAFLRSLTSELILEGNRDLGLFTYVTLGAIVGDFYQKPENQVNNTAFPYKDKLYTIQYQTWWNQEQELKDEGQNNYVYNRTNRALDWMEVARDYDIPNTSGAFISFKDSSIPTRTYFAQNYSRLVEIKENYSKDPFNHFRVRKSII